MIGRLRIEPGGRPTTWGWGHVVAVGLGAWLRSSCCGCLSLRLLVASFCRQRPSSIGQHFQPAALPTCGVIAHPKHFGGGQACAGK